MMGAGGGCEEKTGGYTGSAAGDACAKPPSGGRGRDRRDIDPGARDTKSENSERVSASTGRRFEPFGFRAWDLFRISRFGFRIWSCPQPVTDPKNKKAHERLARGRCQGSGAGLSGANPARTGPLVADGRHGERRRGDRAG